MRWRLLMAVNITLLLSACDGGDAASTTACMGGNKFPDGCAEYGFPAGLSTQVQEESCRSSGGTVSTTCPRQGAIGGCRFQAETTGPAIVMTAWYYGGALEAAPALQADCTASGGTWLAP